MSKKIDYELTDASVLIKAIETNRAALIEKGFTAEREAFIINVFEDAKGKNIEQVKAVKKKNDKTGEQDKAFDKLSVFIQKIQSAAKGAYQENKALLKTFRVGERFPTSVKQLKSWADYFKSILPDHMAELLKNGLIQSDAAEFETRIQNLVAADDVQENAKKEQNSKTKIRDDAMKVLHAEVKRFRSFIDAAFAEDEAMRAKFAPVPEGRGGSGGKDDDGGTTPPAA